MKRVNFRLSDSAYDQLKHLADQRGESMNAAVQYAVQSAVQSAVQDDVQKTAESSSSGDEWKSLYFEERERNVELSGRLLELSGKIADSLQAAQALNAMDKPPALETAEQNQERKTRWQRLKEAWRG